MKKLIYSLASAILMTVAATCFLTGCQELEQNFAKSPGIIEFRADIGHYSLKATDTSFEENDEVSIVAFDPIYSGNVKYVARNGALTSDTPIHWKDGQTEKTSFYLVYPYINGIGDVVEETTFDFTVNADQSSHDKYTKSDLMAGLAAGAPSDGAVHFSISHQLSQVLIRIDNQSEKTIKDVYLSDVYGKVHFSEGKFETTGTQGTIKACPLSTSPKPSWVLVLAPQTSQPELIVTTTGDEQITYTLPEPAIFTSGCKSTADVVISKNSTVTSFTAAISDWTPDNELNFSNEGEDTEWELIGTGKYMDDVFASLFVGIPHYEMDVEFYSNVNDENCLMIKDPYKNWPMIGSSFQLAEGGSIILKKTQDGSYYIAAGSSTGVKVGGYGEITIESPCIANGYSYDYCDFFYEMYDGCLQVGDVTNSIIAVDGSGQQLGSVNKDGMAIFTEPGHIRYPVFYSFSDFSFDTESRCISITKPIDMTRIGIALLPYEESITNQLIQNVLGGTAENQIFTRSGMAGESTISVNPEISKTGVYKVLAAGDCTYADGENYYGYNYYNITYVAPGEEAPACKPEIVSCALSETNPTEINVVIRIPYIASCSIWTVEKSAFDAMHLDESQYLESIYQNGVTQSGSINNYSGPGQKCIVSDLDAKTEYVILVAGSNLFGSSGWAKTTVTTGGELQFTRIGTGKLYDFFAGNFLAGGGTYCASVDILQESTGKPIYRVINPYKALLQQRPELTEDGAYNEGASEYIEFSTHRYAAGNFLFFKPFYSAISYLYDFGEGLLPYALKYTQAVGDIYENPENYVATYKNKEISEGVFQIAPWIDIENTPYGFNYQQDDNVMIICLPGYDLEQTKSGLKPGISRQKPVPATSNDRNLTE